MYTSVPEVALRRCEILKFCNPFQPSNGPQALLPPGPPSALPGPLQHPLETL